MTVERVIQMMREGEHGQTFGVEGEPEVEVEVESPSTGAPPTEPTGSVTG